MRKFLTVTALSGILTFLRMLSSLVIGKAVAMYAGPAGLAMLGQFQSFTGILTGLASATFGTSVVRYTAENTTTGIEACAPWWKASMLWFMAFLLLLAPLSIIFRLEISEKLFGTSDYGWLIFMSVLFMPLMGANTFASSVINGQKRYRQFFYANLLALVISTPLTLFLVFTGGVSGALIAAAITYGIGGVVLVFLERKQSWLNRKYLIGKSERANLLRVGKYVAMALVSVAAGAFSMIAVRQIITDNSGIIQTGQWQAVYKISEIYLTIITTALATYYLPTLSALPSLVEIKKEINRAFILIVPVCVVSASVIYLSRDLIISVLLTDSFRESRDLFATQLIADVVKVSAWVFAYPMLSRGAANWFIYSEVTFAILFVGLTFILVPMHGAQGANMAYLINATIYFIFVYFNLSRFAK